MDLKIGGEDFQALVSKSIVDSLTPETRHKLITDAIQKTLTPPESGSGYGSKPRRSPLQQAFDNAVESYASRYAVEALSNDQAFKTKIEALFADIAKKLFDDQREEIVDGCARMIRQALTKDRY